MSKKKDGVVQSVKVPVQIVAPNDALRGIRLEILEEVMGESKDLLNEAMLAAVCFKKRGITKMSPRDPSKLMSLSGAIYDECKTARKRVPSGILATMIESQVVHLINDYYPGAKDGLNSIPVFKNPHILLPKEGTIIAEKDDQFLFTIPKLGLSAMHIDTSIVLNLMENRLSADKKRLKLLRKNADVSPEKVSSLEREIGELEHGIEMAKSGADMCREMGNPLVLESSLSTRDEGSRAVVASLLANQIGLSGEMSLCNSKLDIRRNKNTRKKELYALLAYRVLPKVLGLNPGKVLGIDMGVGCPVVCAVLGTKERAYLGLKEEIESARAKFRSLDRKNNMRDGFRTKTRNWGTSEREKNWVNTYYHTLVARVRSFAISNGCGTIHMENLSGLRDKMSEEDRLIFIPSKMVQFIKGAVALDGIEVVVGNPKNSSRRCSKCGHTSEKNRSSANVRDFKCVKCGYSCHADYNAAVNIANWTAKEITSGYESDDVEDSDDSVPDLMASPQPVRIAV